jgi:hypothetical protein
MDTELFPAGPNTWAVHEKAGEKIALIQHEGRTFRIELVDQGSRPSPLHGMTLGLYETKEVAMGACRKDFWHRKLSSQHRCQPVR